MPDRPLLIFPRIRPPLKRVTRQTPIANTYRLPSKSEQRQRFGPRLDLMLEAFVTNSPGGMSPENVLVLETTGKIEGFQAAVAAVPGLKWLAEIDIDDIESDDQFFEKPRIGPRFFKDAGIGLNNDDSKELYNTLKNLVFLDDNNYLLDHITSRHIENVIPRKYEQYKEEIIRAIDRQKKKTLSGRMYLSMSNRQALQKVKTLFDDWDRTGRLPHGAGVWASIFHHLRTVRFWDVEDRFRDTGVLEYWQQEVEVKRGTSSTILFEMELHYSETENNRSTNEREVETLISGESGVVTARCHIPEIRFHALKVELPIDSIERVLSGSYSELFKSNSIYFFRPSVQCTTDLTLGGTQEEIGEFQQPDLPPVAALLDGHPLPRHKLLERFLIIDDPDDFGTAYQQNEQRHGTVMASLICHSELDAVDQPLKRRIYVRPILKPDENSYRIPRPEKVPKDVFFEDILERAVRRIFEGDGEIPPQAATVRVINLSVADPDRAFHYFPSPTARLLDWLSYKYCVLFCVSAGNIEGPLFLELDEAAFVALNEEEKLSRTLSAINVNKRNRRILSPSESINAVTIGALHDDLSSITSLGGRIDILPARSLPSPVSSLGHGFHFSVKPDVLLPGGRQFYSYAGSGFYETNLSIQPPGQKVAGAPVNPGEINRVVYSRGTSNATALATRSVCLIYDALELLFEDYIIDFPSDKIAPLLKALLVHSASWGESKELLQRALMLTGGHQIKKEIARYLGYGIPDIQKAVECAINRATAIGWGTIEKDQRHEYRFPLPPSLSGLSEWRRLTVTLAWFSPIAPDNRKYRKAALSFETTGVDHEVGGSRQEAQWQQVKNGTVQHEIIEGNKVVTYQQGQVLTIAVQCREDAGPLDVSVPYGLAVSLEVKEDVAIPIYEEIRAGIEIVLQEQIAEIVR